jgi:hypothetical protein
MPPEVLGRAGLLDSYDSGLAHGFRAPGHLILITGPRGIGKTVMLGVAQDLAKAHGWEVISETATAGLVARLEESIRRLAAARSGASTRGGLGDTQTILGRLQGVGIRLVITVDEIHAVDRGDLGRIGIALETAAGGGVPVAVVVAGLTVEVSALLREEPARFLRHAERIVLRNVPLTDVEESLGRIFAAGGFSAPADTFRQTAEATAGYPFLVQLVGYFLWREAEAGEGLTAIAVTRAIDRAHQWHARTSP